MKTQVRMIGWPKRECEIIPVEGMTRREIMQLTNCPYTTAIDAQKRGYYIVDYLKKAVPPKKGGVEGPIDLGREREVIPIPENISTIEAVMVLFDCKRPTAKRSLERGYYIVDYHQRTVCPDIDKFDAAAAYRMVWFIYKRKFKDRLPWYIEAQDLIQEGVTRLLELSGHPRFEERKFMFFKAYGFMGSYIQSQGRLRGSCIGGEDPGFQEIDRPDAGNAWQAAMAA